MNDYTVSLRALSTAVQNGVISLNELRQYVYETQRAISRLTVACYEADNVVDCGDYSLRVVRSL
jgi:hypothetical protein